MEKSENYDDLVGFLGVLKDQLGSKFIEWLLGDTSEITKKQGAAVDWIKKNTQNHNLADILTYWTPLFREEKGSSVVARIRESVEIAEEDAPLPDNSGTDTVLDALRDMAVYMYGSLLLSDHLGLIGHFNFSAPQHFTATQAIAGDPELPFTANSTDYETIQFSYATGSSGGLQLFFVAESIICYAWEIAKLKKAEPSCADLIEEIHSSLREARRAFSENRFTAVGVAAMSGVVGPPDAEIVLPWGRLRTANGSESPFTSRTMPEFGASTRHDEDGSVITIQDAGDIILEMGMECYSRFLPIGSSSDHALARSSGPCQAVMEKRISMIRLAFLLSWDGEEVPVIAPSWSRFIVPLRQGSGFSYVDLSQYAVRTPTQITLEQMRAWQFWIQKLNEVKLENFGLAPQRLLRASAERRDPYDSLIDAVIAWESLFGAESEITFRISASIAKLMHPAGEDRVELRKLASSIYGLRSQVVHGAITNPDKIRQTSKDAIEIGKSVIRSLVLRHPKLIPMTSAQRSNSILLG